MTCRKDGNECGAEISHSRRAAHISCLILPTAGWKREQGPHRKEVIGDARRAHWRRLCKGGDCGTGNLLYPDELHSIRVVRLDDCEDDDWSEEKECDGSEEPCKILEEFVVEANAHSELAELPTMI